MEAALTGKLDPRGFLSVQATSLPREASPGREMFFGNRTPFSYIQHVNRVTHLIHLTPKMNWKRITTILLALCIFVPQLTLGQHEQSITTEDLYVRDPYVYVDRKAGCYYLYRASMEKDEHGAQQSGVEAFKSKDLKHWTGPHQVYQTPKDNWITGAIWAPEMHEYQGRFYLFATLNSDVVWKGSEEGWPAYTFRGTQIFHADSPLGPFLPFDLQPHTPIEEMALDGTLWEEEGIPYMVYCQEWVEIEDGSMKLVELKPDLSGTAGSPVRLFHASSADWSTGNVHPDGRVSYVTDGCFLYETKSGKLLMIWSSFKNDKYAIGIAESTTGSIKGPWKQHEKPLFDGHGGHGMIFRSLDNRLVLTFHGPNSPAGKERAKFYEIIEDGDTLRLGELLSGE